MSFTATRPRDNAVSGLDPADRALLSLACTRGLDDARIAQLTGVDLEAVRARRERVLSMVAAQLGILPGEVPAALRAPEAPTPAQPRTRARRPWLIVTGVAGLLALGLVVLLVAGRSSRHRAVRIGSVTVARATLSPTPARGSPTPPRDAVTATRIAALRPLPGGPRRTSGTITMHRIDGILTLDLRVSLRSLPRHDHYEAYLYDSILRSRPLGRVRPHRVTRLRLPADAARYRDIDVSDQPRGAMNPSGESRLRGPNLARVYFEAVRRGSRSSAPSTR